MSVGYTRFPNSTFCNECGSDIRGILYVGDTVIFNCRCSSWIGKVVASHLESIAHDRSWDETERRFLNSWHDIVNSWEAERAANG